MSILKSKLARRVMALVLSGAMVMSSMTSSNLTMAGTAYAAEAESELAVDDVNTGEEVSEDKETPEKPEQNLVDGVDNNDGDTSEGGEGGGDPSKPAESTPAGNDPSKPAESTPAGNDSSKPAESTPAGNNPSKPAESTPVESSSVENSSVENSSVENSSVENSSVENSSVENSSVESSSEEGSSEESSSEESSSVADDDFVAHVTYSFDAPTDLTGYSDNDPLDEAQKLGTKGYFKVVHMNYEGTSTEAVTSQVLVRVGTSGKTNGIQMSKWKTSGIQFTIQGAAPATANIIPASTGGKNVSAVALIDGSGKIVQPSSVNLVEGNHGDKETGTPSGLQSDGSVFVYGTSTDNLITYKGLTAEAGPYTFISPEKSEANRDGRLINIEVIDSAPTVTDEYVFDAPTDLTGYSDNDPLDEAQKLGTKGYYKVVFMNYEGTSTEAVTSQVLVRVGTSGKTNGIQMSKWKTSGIQFNVQGKATANIIPASTGGKNVSAVALIDGSGKIVQPSSVNLVEGNHGDKETGTPSGLQSDGSVFVYGTSTDNLITYEGLTAEAGPYTFISPEKSEANRDGRLINITVSDTHAQEEDTPRDEWPGTIAAPEITNVELIGTNKDTIKVTVKAPVEFYTGGDKVTVYMSYKNEDGTETVATSKSSSVERNQHVMEFTPGSSNTYYFSATLERTGEEATINSVDKDADGKDIRKRIYCSIPLGDVEINDITNKGKTDDEKYGIIEAAWISVQEAIYEVAVYEGDVVELASDPTKLAEKSPIYQKDETRTLTLIGKKNANDENSGWIGNAEGLEIGKEYTVCVTAKRALHVEESADEAGSDGTEGAAAEIKYERTKTAAQKITIDGLNIVEWQWSNFGSRANTNTIKEQDVFDKSLTESTSDFEGVPFDAGNANSGVFGKEGDKLVQPGMKRNGYAQILKEDGTLDKVRVWSLETYGKIVPNSTDGVSLYYTAIDPKSYNFKLGADVHVDQWTLSNGQEGFGLVAFDQVVKTETGDGDYEGGDVWNNSYMAIASKIEYKWDMEKNKVANAGSAVSLKLGIGSIVRTGVTAENIGGFKSKDTVADYTKNYFKSVTKPLDTQVHDKSIGNLVGNSTAPVDDTIANPITDFRLEIELNDTGYYISYIPIENGVANEAKKVTNKHYDRNALSHIDDRVYPGFFAARNAMVTFSNIKYETSLYDAATAVPELPETEYIVPQFAIGSATTANSPDYTFVYEANWNGTLTVKDENGNTILTEEIKDEKGNVTAINPVATKKINGSPEEAAKVAQKVTLHTGNNTFQATFEPDELYDPYAGDDTQPPTRLESYATKTETITVTYKTYGAEGQALYVAPLGKASGDGTKMNPLDIYTAVKYVQPGQTIYLMEGTYNLSKTVRIERGTNGTKENPILMIPADASKRPVLDFHNACAGMVLAGNYWSFYGFDVTRSADGQDGIKVSGSYNILDNINTYKNGNTGIQISRLLNSDVDVENPNEWPSYNIIRNCTSYLNADAGYEDADGFACKLTSGYGNEFIGCVAAYNADDGWDLFAKVETGKIGPVTIKNCIAYKNGYVLRGNNGNGELAWYGEAKDVVEVKAGNGNGFKMGGSSITGYHKLENSLAFYNKAKGFDSNSCQDIQVYNSITFNNESYNVAFYTSAATTDYVANGLISYRTDALKVEDKDKNLIDLLTGMEDRIGQKSRSGNSLTEAEKKYSNIIDTQKTKEGKETLDQIFNGTNYFWNQYVGVSELDTDFMNHYTKFYYSEGNADNGTRPTVNAENTVKDSWFVSVDFDSWFGNLKAESIATKVPHVVDRNANGTINVGNFLKLTSEAGKTGIGLPDLSNSTDESVVSKNPDENAPETNGTINKGDADDEIGDNIDSNDFNKKPSGTKVGLWLAIVDEEQIGYTGKAVKPEVHVYYDNTLLTKKQYSITYKNNVNAWLKNTQGYETDARKIPTIIVKGKGNYTGLVERTFEIKPVDLAKETAFNDSLSQHRISAPAITQLKATQKITPVITFIGKKLSDKKDFDYAITDKTADSEGYVTVTGKGNFSGTITVDIIDATNISDPTKLVKNFKVNAIPVQYRKGYTNKYTGEIISYLPVEPILEVKDHKQYDPTTKEGDYTVTYTNNIEIGTATAIIRGVSENGYYGTKEVKFKIIAPTLAMLAKDKTNPDLVFINTYNMTTDVASYDSTGKITFVGEKGINDIKFTVPTTVAYEGKAIQWDELGVAVKAQDGNWYKLTNNKDYTLTYRGNNKAGTANIVVKGKGSYSGTYTEKFTITAFDFSAADLNSLGGTFELTNGKAKYFVTDGTSGGNSGSDENEDTNPSESASEGADTNPSATVNEGAKAGENEDTNPSASTSEGAETEGSTSAGANTGESGDTTVVTPSSPKVDSKKRTVDYGRLNTTVYYDNAGAKPSIALRIKIGNSNNLLRAGKDYTITYKDNRKVTTADRKGNIKYASFIIKGINGFTGTITGTYKVEPRPFNDPENGLQVTATDVILTAKDKTTGAYTGKNNTRIVVKDAKGKTLALNRDYEIAGYEYVANNTYKTLYEVDDKGNPTSTPQTITDNKAVVTLKNADTYSTVKVTVRGKGDKYTSDTLSTYYRIASVKNSIKSAKVVINYGADPINNPCDPQQRYFLYKEGGVVTLNGDTLKLSIKVDGQDKELEFGKHYEVVSYSKNDRKGSAKLIVQGKGQYVDIKTISFKIGAYDITGTVDSSNGEEKPGVEESGEEQTSSTENSNTEESSKAVESSAVESSSREESSVESSKATESSAVESSKAVESSAVESSSREESSVESSSVESSSTEESSVESSSTEESSVESSSTEESSVESSSVEESSVESSSVEESSEAELSVSEDDSTTARSGVGFSTFNAKAPKTSVLDWFTNLFSFR